MPWLIRKIDRGHAKAAKKIKGSSAQTRIMGNLWSSASSTSLAQFTTKEARNGAVLIKLSVKGSNYRIKAVATDKYPPTDFKKAYWTVSGVRTRLLVTISGSFHAKDSSLLIRHFYTKSSEETLVDVQKEEDRTIMRGLGQEVLCAVLCNLPPGIIVSLEASGTLHPSNKVKFNADVQKLSMEDIQTELQKASAIAYDNLLVDCNVGIGKHTLDESELIGAWVGWKLTDRLANYYTEKYGFQKTSDVLEDFYYQPMEASIEKITQKFKEQNTERPRKRPRVEQAS